MESYITILIKRTLRLNKYFYIVYTWKHIDNKKNKIIVYLVGDVILLVILKSSLRKYL